MDWLNYHHLYYFWLVAREGSITRAAEHLQLAHPTISKQLRQLESSLGDKLFKRAGRNLVLTEFGRKVFHYAEEIFSVGQELQDAVRGRGGGRPQQLMVGIPNVLPKLICHRLLRPAFELREEIHMICHEAAPDELLTQLALHRLDLVLSDSPASATVNVRAFSHPLGGSNITFFGTRELVAKVRRRFPHSLDGAPMLLPSDKTLLWRDLNQWFYTTDIRPKILGEFDDTALMKVFGQDGIGLFPAASVIEKQVCQQYSVHPAGRTAEVQERYYALSVERRLKHPAVVAICESAREGLLSSRE
jgi:LysR family transcriptional activator of nhaA